MASPLFNPCHSFYTLLLMFALFNAIIDATCGARTVERIAQNTITTDHAFRHLQRDEQTPPDVQVPTRLTSSVSLSTTTCSGLLCGTLSPPDPTTGFSPSTTPGCQTEVDLLEMSDGSCSFTTAPPPETTTTTTTTTSTQFTTSMDVFPGGITRIHSILPAPTPTTVEDSGSEPTSETPSILTPPTTTDNEGSSESSQSSSDASVTLPVSMTSADTASASTTDTSSDTSSDTLSSRTHKSLVIGVVAGVTFFFLLVPVALICVKLKLWKKLRRRPSPLTLRRPPLTSGRSLSRGATTVPQPFSLGEDDLENGNGSGSRLKDPFASGRVSSQIPSPEKPRISIVQQLAETYSGAARESWRSGGLIPWTGMDLPSQLSRGIKYEMSSLPPIESARHGTVTTEGRSSPFSNIATIASSSSFETYSEMQEINPSCARIADLVLIPRHSEPAAHRTSAVQAIVNGDLDEDCLGPPPSYRSSQRNQGSKCFLDLKKMKL